MSQSDALLRSILENPQDDLPRLVYADWLDEAGEAERAEFLRCQVELARNPQCKFLQLGQDKACIDSARPYDISCETCELRRRERELLKENCWRWFDDRAGDFLVIRVEDNVLFMGREKPNRTLTEATVTRGFVSSVTLDWASWLRHHAGLFWSPRQRVECPACHDTGWVNNYCCYICGKPEDQGTRKMGTGRIPRPFVPTAQPLETVRLTTWPSEGSREHHNTLPGDMLWLVADGYRFDRVKCECDVPFSCPRCNDRPLNRWTCPEWPGVEFVMPQPFGVVESVNPDGTVNVRVGSMV